MNRKIVCELIAKRIHVVPDTEADWQVHYAFFSRSGFTGAAVEEARQPDAILVDLESLGQGLDG